MEFRWNEWNEDHVQRHGVSPEEAAMVVERAGTPFPRMIEDDKRLVWGPGRGGRLLQVIFVLDDDATVFIIHARPLTQKKKQRFRRMAGR